MSGKRVSLASLAASKVESVPGASRPDLIHVPPHTVAPTPLNPRRAFDETDLTELGEDMRSGQLQPCVAVAKTAYVKLYPEHAEQLPEGCRYVMAAGERRWRAAVKVGLDSLDVMLRHDLTESRVRFLAAVLSENIQRANFNPIEEADGLRAMLELHDGNQAAAARAMGKSKAWFNQRIGLLRLSDEMVQLVFEGKLTAFRDMRRYASLPGDEQYRAWKLDQEQPQPRPAQPREEHPAPAAPQPVVERSLGPAEPAEIVTAGPSPAPQAYTAVYAEPGRQGPPTGEPDRVPHSQPAAPSAPAHVLEPSSTIPEPRDEAHEQPELSTLSGLKKFPYDDGEEALMLLLFKMPPAERATVYAGLAKDPDTQAAASR